MRSDGEDGETFERTLGEKRNGIAPAGLALALFECYLLSSGSLITRGGCVSSGRFSGRPALSGARKNGAVGREKAAPNKSRLPSACAAIDSCVTRGARWKVARVNALRVKRALIQNALRHAGQKALTFQALAFFNRATKS